MSDGNIPGKRKRRPPMVSVPVVRTNEVRMYIDTANGPSMWVDTNEGDDHATGGAKPISIEYFVFKRAGAVLLLWDRNPTADPSGIPESLGNDSVAIVGAYATGPGSSNRFRALRSKSFHGLRIYNLDTATGAVLLGHDIQSVTYRGYTEFERLDRVGVTQEVLSWDYDPASIQPELPDDELNAAGRRVHKDEATG